MPAALTIRTNHHTHRTHLTHSTHRTHNESGLAVYGGKPVIQVGEERHSAEMPAKHTRHERHVNDIVRYRDGCPQNGTVSFASIDWKR